MALAQQHSISISRHNCSISNSFALVLFCFPHTFKVRYCIQTSSRGPRANDRQVRHSFALLGARAGVTSTPWRQGMDLTDDASVSGVSACASSQPAQRCCVRQ
jgi:hypothetical protein